MSKKAHMISSEFPISFPDQGLTLTALCQAEVKNAKPLLDIDLVSGLVKCARTTNLLCNVCLALALAPTPWIVHVYGITEAQNAHEANL